jgi:hypothetical protein
MHQDAGRQPALVGRAVAAFQGGHRRRCFRDAMDNAKEALRDGWKGRLMAPIAWMMDHRPRAVVNSMGTRRVWRDEEGYCRALSRAGASRTEPGGQHLVLAWADQRPAPAWACLHLVRGWDGQRLAPASGAQRLGRAWAVEERLQRPGAQQAWTRVGQKWV